MNKKSLREQFLNARLKWDGEHLEEVSKGLNNNIKAMLSAAKLRGGREHGLINTISLFWPMEHRNEIDLRPLAKELIMEGYTVALPVVNTTANTLIFKKFSSEATLVAGKFGLLEPNGSCEEIPYKNIDMVITPALAVDRQGFRLGYGGGYYDKFLAELKSHNTSAITAAAVADEFIVSKLPHDSLDMPVEVIFTEKEVSRI